MKQYLTVVLFLLVGTVFGQKKIVKLKSQRSSTEKYDFFISKVEDVRYNKESIGIVQIGLGNKKVEADLNDGVEVSIQNYLDKLLPFHEFAVPVLMKVTHLFISETIKGTAEVGRAEIEVEFWKEKDGRFGRVFIASSVIEGKGIDVINGHEKRIRKGIHSCLDQFNESNWKTRIPDFNPEKKILAEETKEMKLQETKSFFAKRYEDQPRINTMISFRRDDGIDANGFGISYYRFPEQENAKWIVPLHVTLEYLEFDFWPDEQPDYNEITYSYSKVGLSAFRNMGKNFYFNIGGAIILGNEILEGDWGAKEENFIVGMEANQGIYYIPKSKFGIMFGIGVYERFLSADVYDNDFGYRIELGIKF